MNKKSPVLAGFVDRWEDWLPVGGPALPPAMRIYGQNAKVLMMVVKTADSAALSNNGGGVR